MASSFRRFVGRVAVGALAVAVPVVMTPLAASAATPTDLFFSEYVEGSSNNKALEIYNGTGAAVDLAGGRLHVQAYANGVDRPPSTRRSPSPASVARRRRVVVAHTPARTPRILAVADQTSGIDQLQRRRRRRAAQGQRRVLDVIGQVGVRPRHRVGHRLDQHRSTTPCAARPTSAPATPTAADAFDPAVEWDGFAVDTFDGLGAHTAAAAPSRRTTRPDRDVRRPRPGGTAPVDVSPTVTFSEPVTLAADAAITAQLLGQRRGGLLGHRRPDDLHRRPGRRPRRRRRVHAHRRGLARERRRRQRPAGHHGRPTSTSTFDGRRPVHRPPHPHPGSPGLGRHRRRSPAPRTTRGVVVGDYEGPSPALRGFYLQDPTGDGDPATSDAHLRVQRRQPGPRRRSATSSPSPAPSARTRARPRSR